MIEEDRSGPYGQPPILEQIACSEIKGRLSKLTPHKLCAVLEQRNKALMGRIIDILDQQHIVSLLLQTDHLLRDGCMSSKGGTFIALVKKFLSDTDPTKLSIFRDRKIRTFFPSRVEYIQE